MPERDRLAGWCSGRGPLRRAALAIVTCAALLGGCGGEPVPSAPPALTAGPTCAPRVDPMLPEDGLAEAHERAREVAFALSQRDAAAHIERRTRDGYRLRRLSSTLTMAAGLTLAGALLATLLLPLLVRKPISRYARSLAGVVHSETAAIRALGGAAPPSGDAAPEAAAPDPPSAANQRLFFRFNARLDTADRLADRLADLSDPLERRPHSELAAQKLEGLYDRLERLADAVEVLHLLAVGWRERLERGPDPALDALAATRLDELGDLLEELS